MHHHKNRVPYFLDHSSFSRLYQSSSSCFIKIFNIRSFLYLLFEHFNNYKDDPILGHYTPHPNHLNVKDHIDFVTTIIYQLLSDHYCVSIPNIGRSDYVDYWYNECRDKMVQYLNECFDDEFIKILQTNAMKLNNDTRRYVVLQLLVLKDNLIVGVLDI